MLNRRDTVVQLMAILRTPDNPSVPYVELQNTPHCDPELVLDILQTLYYAGILRRIESMGSSEYQYIF